MFFRQVLHEDLGCASYVLADSGEAAVIDPKWEIDDYLALADEHGFEFRHILETHNHADHVSGKGRLAKATGAAIYVPAKADVAFDHLPLSDGDTVAVGQITITALATPGHRPEHTAYLIADASRGEEPWLVVTGDSLFVGDLARPDLAVEPEEGARELQASMRRLLELDDFAEAWPGHIGGSLCGGAGMSEKPGTTIGFERRFNRLLNLGDEDAFVRELTGHLVPQPPNFKRIVELNRGPLLSEASALEPLAPARVKHLMEAGATLLDGRAPREFDGVHIPRSINVTMTRSAVGTRAAWMWIPRARSSSPPRPTTRPGIRRGFWKRSAFGACPGSSPAASPRGRRPAWKQPPLWPSTSTSWPSGSGAKMCPSSTCARTASGRRATSRARSTFRTTTFGTVPRRGCV